MLESLPGDVEGLDAKEREAFQDLYQIWGNKRPKNSLLSVYYDSEQTFRNIGIAVPDSLAGLHGALGWPAKAVQGLARLHVFEGFSLNGHPDPFDINPILEANQFTLELPQAITSAYKHSCAFITTTPGDTAAGEPEVVIAARDAEWTAARWDKRRRQIKYALAITDTDNMASPTEAILFLPGMTVTISKSKGVWAVTSRSQNPLGRVLMEPITYDPQLDRPFGRTRITREVRYLTDAAIRTMLRTEVHAEFFSSPQRTLLGADEETFDEVRWQATIGRIWGIGLNDEGDTPTLQQLTQSSMQPHLEVYRQLAQNFCAATNLPQSSVGIYADNPQSAEAMEASYAELAADGEYQWRVMGPSLKRVAQNVVALRDRSQSVPEESWKLEANWTPCRYVSPAVAADWATKAVAADPGLQGTTVLRRRLGLSQAELQEVQAETADATALAAFETLVAELGGANENPEG